MGKCFVFNDSIIVQSKWGHASYLTIQLLHNLGGDKFFVSNDSIIAQFRWGNVSNLTIQLLHNIGGKYVSYLTIH